MDLRPNFELAPLVKLMINVGALCDVPTGSYLKGKFGEHILNGGLGILTAVVGIGNNFKSTFADFLLLTAASRFKGSYINHYDTEVNIHEDHKRKFYQKIAGFNGEDLLTSGRWTITDKTLYTGDEYYDKMKDYQLAKKKNAATIMITTPFLDRDGKSRMKVIQPTFRSIDSFSEFVTQDVIKMQDENELGESGGNTIFMRQGLQKSRFLMEVPGNASAAYDYITLTAHIGTEFSMDPRNPPPKKLQHLKGGQKIKGAPEKFTFVTNNCWHCYNAAPLINQGTKSPEYPRSPEDDLVGDTDLNVVTIRQLRNKSGPTGMAIEILVSQQEGVLPSLTEFHYIKENERFGLEGNVQNYVVSLAPHHKLSRTTVRGKLDKNFDLRRAVNICAELCQMTDLWHHLDQRLLCTPKQLYDDLKARGYDWEILLNTRGYWVSEDKEDEEPPFLSTMDLLLMRAGIYVPYWYSKELLAKINTKLSDGIAENDILVLSHRPDPVAA